MKAFASWLSLSAVRLAAVGMGSALVSLVFVIVVVAAARELRTTQDRYVQTARVIAAARRVEAVLAEAETGIWRFRVTGRTTDLSPLHHMYPRLKRAFAALQQGALSDVVPPNRIDSLRTVAYARADALYRLASDGAAENAAGRLAAPDVERLAQSVAHAAEHALEERSRAQERRFRAFRSALLQAGGVTVLLLIALNGLAGRLGWVALARQRRFRAFIEHATEVVTLLDADGTINYESPSVTAVLGFAPAELVGRNVLDLVHPDETADAAEQLAACRAAGGRVVSGEFRFRDRDGNWCLLDFRARNLLHDPAVRGIVVNSRDVTAERSVEQQLHQAQKVEAVGQLAGAVAHDFNNMLTAVRGHIELMLQDLPAGQMREDAESVGRAADSAAALTRQLLAFSRRDIIQPTLLDASAVLRELQLMLRRLVHSDIALDMSGVQPGQWIHMDRSQFEQVVLNLVVNARDALPNGGTIRILCAPAPADARAPQERVALSVCDDGCGIDARTLQRIFEPFFTTKAAGQGTGLGLATVKRVVEQAGGEISVTSAPGEGARFDVLLPRCQAAPAPADTAPVLRQAATSGKVLLLAEDQAEVRHLAARILRRSGYLVLEADNGREALARAASAPAIHALLTDLVMPEMGGSELINRLRQTHPELPIVVMSGYTEDEAVRRGIIEHDVQFLAKPFTPRELLQKLNETTSGAAPAGSGGLQPRGEHAHA